MNVHNIKLAIRNLRRNKLYSILVITGFSVGFAVCLYIALFIYNELRMDRCFPGFRNIVRVYDPAENNCGLDVAINQNFKTDYPEVRAACFADQFNRAGISAKSETRFTRFTGLISTSNDFFNVFPVRIIMSLGKHPFEGKESVVITKSIAGILFPGEDPLGKPITVFDYQKGQITAVIEDFPKHSGIQGKVLLNADNPDFRLSTSCDNGRCWDPMSHFLLLRPGTDIAALGGKMNADIPKNHPEIKAIALQKLTAIYLSVPMDGNGNLTGNFSLLLIFFSVGLVVLVLSVINFLNFYISVQFKKLKEVGIKKINGASYTNLLGYSIAESSLSILIAILIAFGLCWCFLPLANRLYERQLEAEWLFRPVMILVWLGITFVIILINSIAPLAVLSGFNTSSFLGKMKTSGNQKSGRHILTMFQLTASIVLMIMVLSLYRQISYAEHADLGFDKERLVRLKFPFGFKEQDAFKQKLEELSFCRSASLSRGVPGEINLTMGDGKGHPMFKCLYVDEDFTETMGLKMQAGRRFLSGDMGVSCIINEEALRQNEWTGFEGKRFNNGREGGYQVVGVVKDFHVESMHSKIQPVCLLAWAPDRHGDLFNISVRLTPGNLGQQMDGLRQVWKDFIPDEPMTYSFYDEQFDAMYRKDEQLGQAIGITSIIALILTFMGILGQIFQVSLNRTKEIGVRKVNGAKVSDILIYMNREFLVWVALSLVLAVPMAWYLVHKWLENFAYKAEISWWIFLLSGMIMLITVISTVTLQSWNAATRNPVEALRYE